MKKISSGFIETASNYGKLVEKAAGIDDTQETPSYSLQIGEA